MISYSTLTVQRRLADKVFVLEVIRDLDEAIDLLCGELGETADPFAEDLCPYFGILWPAAEVLANYLAENAELVRGRDVLELGCGLGFPSMVAAHLGAHVLATDFHPDVAFYFQRNCRHSSQDIAYRRFNWREGAEDVGLFDVVMGSDILYESKHPGEVVAGLTRFLRPGGVILLADPGRAYLGKFLEGMKAAGLEGKMDPGAGAQVHAFRRSST